MSTTTDNSINLGPRPQLPCPRAEITKARNAMSRKAREAFPRGYEMWLDPDTDDVIATDDPDHPVRQQDDPNRCIEFTRNLDKRSRPVFSV